MTEGSNTLDAERALEDVSDIDINAPRSSMERLLLLAHSALRQDLLLVTVSHRTQAFWQAHPDTGPFELAALKAGKRGWFVTEPNGSVLIERWLVTPEYRGDTDAIEGDR